MLLDWLGGWLSLFASLFPTPTIDSCDIRTAGEIHRLGRDTRFTGIHFIYPKRLHRCLCRPFRILEPLPARRRIQSA